jgi:hypothetical protein
MMLMKRKEVIENESDEWRVTRLRQSPNLEERQGEILRGAQDGSSTSRAADSEAEPARQWINRKSQIEYGPMPPQLAENGALC